MSDSEHAQAHRSSFSVVRVLAVVIPVSIIAVIVGFSAARMMEPRPDTEVMPKLLGLANPVQNRLADVFIDDDGDLVADPPTNQSDFVSPETLRFCYVAVENAEEYAEAWQPFVDHLSSIAGLPVEYAALTDSNEQLRALRDGDLHVTGLNTGSVPVAVNQAGFVPVCKVPSPEGVGEYRMEIIVPADSHIQSPADFEDSQIEFAFTHMKSNSGYKAAVVLLHQQFSLTPGADYYFHLTGGHQASIAQVAAQHCDAAAVASDMLRAEVDSGNINADQYRSIYASEPFPTACLGYAHNLAPDLAAKVQEAMTTFDWSGTTLVDQFASASETRFVAANYKDDWGLIRLIDDATGTKHQIEGNTP